MSLRRYSGWTMFRPVGVWRPTVTAHRPTISGIAVTPMPAPMSARECTNRNSVFRRHASDTPRPSMGHLSWVVAREYFRSVLRFERHKTDMARKLYLHKISVNIIETVYPSEAIEKEVKRRYTVKEQVKEFWFMRSKERSEGKEWVNKCRFRWLTST